MTPTTAPSGQLAVDSDDPTLALDHTSYAPLLDAFAPSVMPDRPMGRVGYTRYVFTQSGDQIIPALVEGPKGSQTRCQVVALPCSFQDLKDLFDSGEPIPAELNMTAAELGSLVEQLGQVQDTLQRFADVNDACAAGYSPDRTQTPNMGSHFTNFPLILDGRFDPSAPEILLFVAADDSTPPFGALGRCKDGGWKGVDVEIAGAAFYMPFAAVGNDHFEGFSGPLDNWHIHYNLCRLSGQDVTVLPSVCSGATNGPLDQPQGDASEGWMIHAWADGDHDNQLGAFSMWNPAIWPLADPNASGVGSIGSRTASNTNLIADFDYQVVEAAVPGKIAFFNSDAEAHSVTAGTPENPTGQFDSGIMGGGSAATIEISQPGTYEFFCSLHPGMTGSITVGGG
ncbi:MAG: plastocyanin/azurin family copper-binding protein [Actinomycetota bacterium]|nr:plastocyanin/azurin family copper-binding protein [Actinomycetota bacterium]